MEIVAKKYRIIYDATQASICYHGALFLNGTEQYNALFNLMKEAANQQSACLTLDLRPLEFLNSSGINTIMRFVNYIADTKSTDFKLIVLANKTNLFHHRLSENLRRLLPTLQIQLE